MTVSDDKTVMRVLVTDDSAFMRRAICSMLNSDPDIEVVGIARNGREAVEAAKRLQPDVITLDIEMPEMDGLTALRHIMRDSPTQVLMLSSLTTEGSHVSLKALSLGAADVLAKDQSQVSLKINDLRNELVQRIRALGASRRFKGGVAGIARPARPPVPKFRHGAFDVVCIGSSTGGPPVLETILASLPGDLATPIVVAQHMPEVFTRSMAERLGNTCQLRVVHAGHGDPLSKRTIHIAPGGQHLKLQKDGLAKWKLSVGPQPVSHRYKPSVDALFTSAAESVGRRTLAIVLTGIGDDGLAGARTLHALGAPVIAQSQETCVVYGMPKVVTQAGITIASLTPTEITRTLLSLTTTPARAA